MLVSICVPVYNVEKYIERCAVSLFKQSYNPIEFIFVNDQTPDSSMKKLMAVIDEWPHRKNQVKIIHHERNRGLSAVRNTALNHCIGDFVLHVDSDDFLEVGAVEKLVKKQQETGADIVTGQVIRMSKEKNYILERPQFVNREDFVEDMIEPSIHHAIWGRLIRKLLYTENNIIAKEGVDIGEDLQVMTQLAYYAKKTESIWDIVYYYDCTNELSYMNQFNIKDVKRLVQDTRSMELVRDFLVGKNDKLVDRSEKYLRDYYLDLLRSYGRLGMRDDFVKIQHQLSVLQPQNRKMSITQKIKFHSYQMFKIVNSLK